MLGWWYKLQDAGLVGQLAVLGAVALALGVALAPIAVWLSGAIGVVAMAVAGLICAVGAGHAMALSRMCRGPQRFLQGVLLGMLARIGIPLGIALALFARGGPLIEAHLLEYFLVFYPVTLGVQTAVSLPRSQTSRRSFGAIRVNGLDD